MSPAKLCPRSWGSRMVKSTRPGGATESSRSTRLLSAPMARSRPAFFVSIRIEPRSAAVEVFKAELAELVVFCRRARHFIIEPLLPIAPRRLRLLDRAIPALVQILGSAFGILPNALQFLAKMRLGRLGAQIEQSHRPPDRDGQRPGRRPGRKPSEEVQD